MRGEIFALLIATSCFADTVRVPGIQKQVEILRDRWGVPHIYASTVHDLFFAQGYITARDRLFQIDLWRRVGTGKLAEVLGPSGDRSRPTGPRRELPRRLERGVGRVRPRRKEPSSPRSPTASTLHQRRSTASGRGISARRLRSGTVGARGLRQPRGRSDHDAKSEPRDARMPLDIQRIGLEGAAQVDAPRSGRPARNSAQGLDLSAITDDILARLSAERSGRCDSPPSRAATTGWWTAP